MYSTGSYEGIGFSYLEYFNLENPYIEVPTEGEWSRVWHNHDKIRPATWFELLQFSRALVQAVKAGKTIMDVELPGLFKNE